MSQQIVQSDMEALRECAKFADDKKLSETLKEKEDYRKEFIGNISHNENYLPSRAMYSPCLKAP